MPEIALVRDPEKLFASITTNETPRESFFVVVVNIQILVMTSALPDVFSDPTRMRHFKNIQFGNSSDVKYDFVYG